MNTLKITFLVTVISMMSSPVMANSYATSSSGHSFRSGNFSGQHIVGQGAIYSNASTHMFYYKVGVTQFEKGNLNKAERAFKAVLRSRGPKKEAYLYLAKIAEAKGDIPNAQKHAALYHEVKR